MRDVKCLELVPMLMGIFIWGSSYNLFLFRTNNEALVSIIDKRTSKSKRVMQLIRTLAFVTMQVQYLVKGLYTSRALIME